MSTATVSSLGSLTEFTLFSELPTEIRQDIWVLTLKPRVIGLEMGKFSWIAPIISQANKDRPVAFSVNKDSREAVKIYYRKCFGTGYYPASTWINFNIDTVYLDPYHFRYRDGDGSIQTRENISQLFAGMTPEEKASIKYLTIDKQFQDLFLLDNVVTYDIIQKEVESMTNLKELGIMSDVASLGRRSGYWKIDMKGKMRLFEKFPSGIEEVDAIFNIEDRQVINDVESLMDLRNFKDWNVRSMREVFGWRDGTVYQVYENWP